MTESVKVQSSARVTLKAYMFAVDVLRGVAVEAILDEALGV